MRHSPPRRTRACTSRRRLRYLRARAPKREHAARCPSSCTMTPSAVSVAAQTICGPLNDCGAASAAREATRNSINTSSVTNVTAPPRVKSGCAFASSGLSTREPSSLCRSRMGLVLFARVSVAWKHTDSADSLSTRPAISVDTLMPSRDDARSASDTSVPCDRLSSSTAAIAALTTKCRSSTATM